MTEEQLAQFKTQLLTIKAQVETDRASYREADRSASEEEDNETTDYDPNDPGDEASNLFDRERDEAAIENMDAILSKVNRALQKMDEGTYGLSEIDNTPIPLERLKALPYALTTIEQEEAH